MGQASNPRGAVESLTRRIEYPDVAPLTGARMTVVSSEAALAYRIRIGDRARVHTSSAGMLIYGGVGAGLGALIDLVHGRTTIYMGSHSRRKLTFAPILTGNEKGVLVSFSFQSRRASGGASSRRPRSRRARTSGDGGG